MKKLILSMSLLMMTTLGEALAATPDFSQMGFATMEGGTTGGAGGKVVTPANFEELKAYAEADTTPYVIVIDHEFTTGIKCTVDETGTLTTDGSGTESTYGEVISLGSNKTLIGVNCNAMLNRIGLNVQCHENIIIRNIKFTMVGVPISKTDENKIIAFRDGAETLIGDPDCISIQADKETIPAADRISQHIWIDHCEFYNEDPDVMTDYDRYDGLVDTKNNSIYITISWCYFHDHHKSCLIGKGGSDSYNHKTTFSHNKFEKIASRLPLFRYGNGHLLNNYMVNCDNGANMRVGSDLYLEGNYYDNDKKPMFGKTSDSPAGVATLVNNKFISCDRLPAIVGKNDDDAKCSALSSSEEFETGTWNPSSDYAYTADNVEDVPTLINTYAGPCVLSDEVINEYLKQEATNVESTLADLCLAYSSDRSIYAVAANGAKAQVYSADGRLVYAGNVNGNNTAICAVNGTGVYAVKLGEKIFKVVVR